MSWIDEPATQDARLLAEAEPRYLGKFRGVVVDNKDPYEMGRLQVKVPAVLGDVATGWAMPCVPFGGSPDRGLLALPQVDDTVWVEFEGGDLEFPIWVGTFWITRPVEAGSTPPKISKPTGDAGGETPYGNEHAPKDCLVLKTHGGHALQMRDAKEPGDDEPEELVLLRAAPRDGDDEDVQKYFALGKEAIVLVVDSPEKSSLRLKKDVVDLTVGEDGDSPKKSSLSLKKDMLVFAVDKGDAKINKISIREDEIQIEDHWGSQITLSKEQVLILDKNKNKAQLDGNGVELAALDTDNKIAIAKSGVTIAAPGQTIELKAGKIKLTEA